MDVAAPSTRLATVRRAACGAAIALILLGLCPSLAQGFNSRVGGYVKTGSGVLLKQTEFKVHEGNEKCRDAEDPAKMLAESSTNAWCYQANGYFGEGAYDTEIWFDYTIYTGADRGDYRGDLINRLSRRCLDLKGGVAGDGTPVQTYDCNDTPAQQFRFEDDQLTVKGACVLAPSGDDEAIVAECNEAPNRRWRIDGDGRLVASDNRCLDIVGHSADNARLRLARCDDAPSQRWYERSAYIIAGHALVKAVGRPNQVTCSVQRTFDGPARRFSCDASTTEGRVRDDIDPGPIWTVTGPPPPPADADRVVFIGDSVTAGFGYCGAEGGGKSANVHCGVNQPMANSWALGDNSLQDCAPLDPPDTVNDRCSNNNFYGRPWNAGPWADQRTAPTVAYPFQIAKRQRAPEQASVENWAVTGSTPAHWDPDKGAFGDQTESIRDSWVAMTLGANPLLSYYLDIGFSGIAIQGVCADSTKAGRNRTFAAPLDDKQHSEGYWGVLHCFDEWWTKLDQGFHLKQVYKSLLSRGNRVLVVGYPVVCPWSFGLWQPRPNIALGPAQGDACNKPGSERQVWDDFDHKISQWDQAKALGAHANDLLKRTADAAARESGRPDAIAFVEPDQADVSKHQAWTDDPWVFKNDTWVHPNEKGHDNLAKTVTRGFCSNWKRWCGDPPRWKDG